MLLLQVRADETAAAHERQCYLESSQLVPEALDAQNLLQEPRIAPDRVARADAVIIGGSGECTVREQYPFSRPLEDLVLESVERGKPLLGACWGHHFLASVLGGEVVTDPSSEEIGTFDVELTVAGAEDLLFGAFPRRFPAQLGHHDRVARLPPGVRELAFSRRCRNQALGVAGKPVYGIQFHSEMTREQLLYRLRLYAGSYLKEGPGVEGRVRESEVIRPLLDRFLTLFC